MALTTDQKSFVDWGLDRGMDKRDIIAAMALSKLTGKTMDTVKTTLLATEKDVMTFLLEK